MTERTGACLCGQVLPTTAEPLVARICWCHDCQRIAGNGTANALLPTAAIEVSGATSEYVREADSGNRVHRRLPALRLPPVRRLDGRPGFTVVRLGTGRPVDGRAGGQHLERQRTALACLTRRWSASSASPRHPKPHRRAERHPHGPRPSRAMTTEPSAEDTATWHWRVAAQANNRAWDLTRRPPGPPRRTKTTCKPPMRRCSSGSASAMPATVPRGAAAGARLRAVAAAAARPALPRAVRAPLPATAQRPVEQALAHAVAGRVAAAAGDAEAHARHYRQAETSARHAGPCRRPRHARRDLARDSTRTTALLLDATSLKALDDRRTGVDRPRTTTFPGGRMELVGADADDATGLPGGAERRLRGSAAGDRPRGRGIGIRATALRPRPCSPCGDDAARQGDVE